jgi:excisionase family DNA binding protein
MDRIFLSPRQAADRAGCGRSSIMRALSSGDLPAHRDNRNTWQIETEALDKWASDRSGHIADNDRTEVADRSGQDRTPVPDRPETLARLAVAEARLADVTAERDRLAALLEKALEPRPGLIERLARLVRG